MTLSAVPEDSSDSCTVTRCDIGAGRNCCKAPWSLARLAGPAVAEEGREECVSDGQGLGTMAEMAQWKPPRSVANSSHAVLMTLPKMGRGGNLYPKRFSYDTNIASTAHTSRSGTGETNSGSRWLNCVANRSTMG